MDGAPSLPPNWRSWVSNNDPEEGIYYATRIRHTDVTPYPGLVATVWAGSWADLVSAAWGQVDAESAVANGPLSGPGQPVRRQSCGSIYEHMANASRGMSELGLFERLAREMREDKEARGETP